jgi:hypothetical protein
MGKGKLQLDVDRLSAGKPVTWIVSTTDKEATLVDLVEMTEDQAKEMVKELSAAKQRRRIVDYDVRLVIDGVHSHGKYALGVSSWLSKHIPGERKVSADKVYERTEAK